LGLALVSVSAQDAIDGDLASNPEMWKSFQEEMRTLEEAAHRVNALLSGGGHHEHKQAAEEPADMAPDTDTNTDVTVLSKHTPSPVQDSEKKEEDKKEQDGGVQTPFNPHSYLGEFMNSFGLFKLKNFPEPWWKGKNVCMEESEKVEEKKKGEERGLNAHVLVFGTGTFEHCKQTSGKYICTTVLSSPDSTKTVSRTYQCCEGFRRQADGCVPVELKPVVEVLAGVGCPQFASLAQSKLSTLGERNITVFAPVDQAMRSMHVHFQESNQIRGKRAVEEEWSEAAGASGPDFIMTHITDSLMDVDDFSNEMVVKSLHNGSRLRVNIYPGREEAVMTVNCARVKTWDHVATHARVHTLERVLEPVTQSVSDILSQPQFSQFKQYLEQEGLLETITNSSAVTVLAPTNQAWDKLGSGLRDKYSRRQACIDRVLRHHILPLTLCGAAAPQGEGRLSTSDLEGEAVRLSRNSDGQLVVNNKARIAQEDLVATNGVVHVLDKVLTPKSAKPLSELLVASNLTTWLDLLARAGLVDELDKMDNVTVLVPSETALADNQTRASLSAMSSEELRRVMLYHVTEPAPACDLQPHTHLRTRLGDTLHVTAFNSMSQLALFAGLELRKAVQCAALARTDGKACHVIAHEVSRLLLPPSGSVLDLLAQDPKLSIVNQIIQGTELEKELKEKTIEDFTLLAPSAEAFDELKKNVTDRLLVDKKFADEFLRMHLITDWVCCNSITPMPWPLNNYVRTVGGHKVEVNRARDNTVMFGSSAVSKCDVIATDGILHVVDNVLLPDNLTDYLVNSEPQKKLGDVIFGTPNKQIMLFGI